MHPDRAAGGWLEGERQLAALWCLTLAAIRSFHSRDPYQQTDLAHASTRVSTQENARTNLLPEAVLGMYLLLTCPARPSDPRD